MKNSYFIINHPELLKNFLYKYRTKKNFWFYSAYCLFLSCQFFGARVNVRCGLSKHKIIGNLDYIFRLSTYSGIYLPKNFNL